MADDLDEIVGRAEVAAVVRPGDTLIFRVAATNRQQLDEIAEVLTNSLRERLPDDVKLALIAGVEQILVYHPDPI